MDFAEGDHFIVYDGLDHKVNSFVWQTDVDFPEGQEKPSAALTFGFPSKEGADSNWYGANLDSGRTGDDAFRVFGPGMADTNTGGSAAGVDLTKTIHFEIDVHADGAFEYSFGNTGADLRTISGTIPNWRGGYLGLLAFNSAATFSNVALEEREEEIKKPDGGKVVVNDDFNYNNNIAAEDLSDLSTESGVWEAQENGLYSKSENGGDVFLYSQTVGGDFVYSTDVTFLSEQGAAALLFRNADKNGHAETYAANFDIGAKAGKFWRWEDGMDYQLSGQIGFTGEAVENNTYTLTVTAIGGWISYYINGELIASTGDYHKIGGADYGQDTIIQEGTFGLLNWNGEMIFQNTVYTPIEDDFTPLLSDITRRGGQGTVYFNRAYHDSICQK